MKPEFGMEIDMNVLEHIGLKLYSSFPSIIAEYVSNSWDAGAENVEVSVPQEPLSSSYSVEIRDNGRGMSPEEVNSNFLAIGRRSRKEENSSVKVKGDTRQRMGRKGIGVLSGFSIARVLEVETQRDGEYTALRINYNDIARSTESEGTNVTYHPEVLEKESTPERESGTTIRLSQLDRKQRPRVDYVRQKLARQFSITTQNFIVLVNGEEVDISDRNLKSRCEYTWPIHESNIGPKNHEIMGWIGTMKNPVGGDFEQGIAIVANGRVIQKPRDFRPRNEEEEMPLQYIVGTIHADFLDEEIDLIKTNRSSVIWDKEPAKSLESRMRENMSGIVKEWNDRRRDKYLNTGGFPKPRYLNGYTLDELISEYEGHNVEYKEELSSGKKFAKEVVAFANSNGGVIIVGVEDDTGDVVGVDNPDRVEGRIVGWVRDLIDPPISPSIDIEVYEGESVLIVEVLPNMQKACSVNGRFIQRVGSRNKSMTFDELMQNWPKNPK